MRSDSPLSARNFHAEEFLTKMAIRTARTAKNPSVFREMANNIHSVLRPFHARWRPPMEVTEYVYIQFFVMFNVSMVM